LKTGKRARVRTIDLNIVVLPALDQKTKAEPLFDLAGGPARKSARSADRLPRTARQIEINGSAFVF